MNSLVLCFPSDASSQRRGGPNRPPRGAPNHVNRDNGRQQNRGGVDSPRRVIRSGSDPQATDSEELPSLSPQIDSMELYADEKQLVKRIEIERSVGGRNLRLKHPWQQYYNLNPHLREVFLNGQHLQFDKRNNFSKDDRRLTLPLPSSASQPASPAPKKDCTTEHWGQRKLFLTEIEFLTRYAEDNPYLVVYAGAAPGLHIPFLSQLFPRLEFVLIDEKDFPFQGTEKIRIRSERFSKDLARRYCEDNRKVLFICNVRTYRAQSDATNDLKEDLQNQVDWYDTLRPQMSLLNFRHSRELGKLPYLKGHLIIEPWSSRRSTECRLVVEKDAKNIEYKFEDFDEAMRYFQSVTRITYYEHDMDGVENDEFDHCYDCRAEIYILEKYLTKVQKVKADNNLTKVIASLSRQISKAIRDKTRPAFINAERTLGIIPKKLTEQF